MITKDLGMSLLADWKIAIFNCLVYRIENHFISAFMHRKLEEFNGFIPLFIQWVDIHVYTLDYNEKPQLRNNSIPKFNDMPSLIRPVRACSTFGNSPLMIVPCSCSYCGRMCYIGR
jgi:hypothetical protein